MRLLNSKLVKNWLNNINPPPIHLDLQESSSKINQTLDNKMDNSKLKQINKKILFLEPRGVEANVFSFAMKYPLLGPLRMTTILRQHGYNAIMYHENLAKKDIPENLLKNADILILTLLTMTCKRGYQLAQKYKELRPDGWVIIGGIHPSLNPDEAVPYCDQIVVGEGEEIIVDLIERNERYAGKIVRTERIKDLTKLPIPDFNCVVNSKRIKIAPILTSLGCPFNCSFCCVTTMYGRGYRRFSVKQIIDSIKKYNKKKIFFIDDNFCADKKRSVKIFDEINKLNRKYLWLAQVRADIAKDEEFIKKMALAGCRRVFIGFESINQDSLNQVVKNETLEIYEKAIQRFHKYGIAIHGMFILGLESDKKDIFKNTLKFITKNHIESCQFLLITPFTGTRFYQEIEESRFITKNTDFYDGNHVIIKPRHMTPYELFKGMIWLYTRFYSWWNIFRQLIYDIRKFREQNIRSFGYRIRKMLNNFFRSIGFRLIIRRLKWISRKYKKELKILSISS
ncbi:MAG: B12-binding domain-containing radical SAM protein [Promethearchaeota archaeon]